MGPIIIFDKSALECLNPDEAVWLDQFFTSNITPLFYIETLADLEKQVRRGRSPEAVVGSLAYRTPDMSSRPNTHHLRLLEAELLGGVTLDLEHGRPNLLGGQRLELDGKAGVVFRQTPEEVAVSRWRQGEFLDLERQQARQWRANLSKLDLGEVYKSYQRFFPIGKPTTLAGIRQLAEAHLSAVDARTALSFGLSFLPITPQHERLVLDRWRQAGRPPMRHFAPYLYHVTLVDLFFYMAIAADLIGRDRPSHSVDMAYLYYLPFCMVFASNDKLHAQVAPLFLTPNQSYVAGADLKRDLAKLDAYYEALPPEVKARGVMSFAPRPPLEGGFLVTHLWDRHMSPKWREQSTPAVDPQSDAGKRLAEEIKRLVEEADKAATTATRGAEGDALDYMVVQRMVRRRMGKWERFTL